MLLVENAQRFLALVPLFLHICLDLGLPFLLFLS